MKNFSRFILTSSVLVLSFFLISTSKVSTTVLVNEENESMSFVAADLDDELVNSCAQTCLDAIDANLQCGSTGDFQTCLRAARLTNECADCSTEDDDGGGGTPCEPTVFPEDVCDGRVTTAGEYECDYFGGETIDYNDGCVHRRICCVEIPS